MQALQSLVSKSCTDIEIEDIRGCIASRSANSYICGVKFRVTIESNEDGVFIAESPVLPGSISQGGTRDEAMANNRDAIQGYVESLKKHGPGTCMKSRMSWQSLSTYFGNFGAESFKNFFGDRL